MDPQVQEFANEIARAAEERIKAHFDRSEERVKSHFDESEQRVKLHFDQSEQRVKSHFDQSEQRIKSHLEQFEQRAELRMKMHFENLEYVVKLAAEGYGATLERIERDVAGLKSTTQGGFADVKAVLENHNGRITKLEEAQR